MPKVIDLPTATSMDDGDYLIMEESSGGTKKITRSNAVNLSVIGGSLIQPSLRIPAGSSISITAGTNRNWTSMLILGSVGQSGPVIIGVRISNGALSEAKNLMTNAAWSGTGLVITASSGTITFTNNASDQTQITVYAG